MIHRHNLAMGFDNPIEYHAFIHRTAIPSGKMRKTARRKILGREENGSQ
jgi:hypothetical protein